MSDSGLRGVRSDEFSRLQRGALLALALLASAAVLAIVLFAADSFAGREAAEASQALPCADLNGNGLVTQTDVDISFTFDGQAVPPAPPQVDQNSDGVIDNLDHQAVADQVGTSGVTCQDTPVDCAADVNRSGEVNETDVNVVSSYYGQSSPPAPPQVDLDGDGVISISDILWVIQRNGLVTDLIPCQDTAVDCLADLDGDGQIASGDVDIAMSWWGQSVPPAPYQTDLMLGDRDVSIHDVQFVAGRVGMSIEACQENPLGPPPLPDLAIGSIDGDSRAWPGEEITHRVVVENLGAGAAPATTLYVELLYPRSPITEFEYVPVGEFAVPALGAGEQAVVEYTATIPEWWDPYEFGRARHAIVSIDADDLIAEESEANNADSRQVGMSLFVYDVDGTGTADGTDAQLVHVLQGATHVSLEWNPDADVNEDGVLDANDVDAVLAHEGEVAGHAVPTLSVSPTSGVVPLAVTFNYEAHTHEGTISQLEIDFEGDDIWDLVVPAGTASISGSTQHTFTTVGVYEPTIRSTDSNGSLKTQTTEIVAAPNLSLAQLIDNGDRGGIEAWSAVRTIAEINTAVAALDSAHREDLAEVLLDSNATDSLRSTLLTAMQDVLSQPELGFFAEIWSYTYIEMTGDGYFGGCGHLYLTPDGYGRLDPDEARGVLMHESFHSFNCVNSGPIGALNEGSAIWIGLAVYSNPLLPGQSFAEATYGTKLWYRDKREPPQPNYPLKVADDPSNKLIEIFTWMSSQDPSGLPWNSQGRLTHCYESYWEHLDRDVDFYTVWLPAAEEAMQAMQGDPLCQRPSTPRVTGFEVDVRTSTTMKLSWEPVAGAESYERCVNDLPHTTGWICVDVGNISSELTAVPTAEGVYYYAVRGVAADGSTGPLSNRGVVTVINSTVDSVTYHSYHTAYKDSDGVKQVNSFNLGLASAYLGFSNWTDPDNVGSVLAGGRRHAVAQPWTDADLLSIYGPVVVALESPNASLSPQKWIGLSTLCMVIDESLCP